MKAVLRQNAEKLFYRGFLWVLRRIGLGEHKPPRQVLVFKPDRIGDFVLATGAMHLLCRKFGPREITLAVSTLLEPLARREFPECQILVVQQPRTQAGNHWRRALLAGWETARKTNVWHRYSRLINLRHHPTLLEDLLLGSIRCEDSIGTAGSFHGDKHWTGKLRTFQPRRSVAYPLAPPPPGVCLELEANRLVAQAALGRAVSLPEITPRLSFPAVAPERYFLVLPYSSEKIKDYPESQLVESLAQSELTAAVPLILCGEAAQTARLARLAEAIQQRLPNPVRLAPPGGLLDFCQLVAGAWCVLSMDSAAAHIVTTLDKRGVFILGGGHYGEFAPWVRSARQQWLSVMLPCFGCDWVCNQPYVRCIADVPPAAVAGALRQVRNESDGPV